MEKYLKKKTKINNSQLEKFFPRKITKKWLKKAVEKIDFAIDEKTLTESISKPIWDFLDRGGKRWRPALMLLSCKAVGGSEKKALPLTVIPELVHSGTIIIDDLEDDTAFRRGKPALHKIYGLDLAVNNGSLLYFLPLLSLTQNSSFSQRQKLAIYNVYFQEMLKLSFGQSMDIYWHQGKKVVVTEEEYLQMCVFKTGTLARLSAKIGAIVGGGSISQVLALGDFASTIGVAFQIQDDILNISSHTSLGKEFGDDIQEGKRTLLVIHALNNCSKKDAEKLLRILSSHESRKNKIVEAIGVIKKAGSISYSKQVAIKLVNESWRRLDRNLQDSLAKKRLFELAHFFINREF